MYPQAPMVKTRVLDLIHFDNVPGGQNAIVAVMSYSGYDIEDAIVLNKSSLDRGFGRCMVLRKHQTVIKRYPNQTYDRIVGPPDFEALGITSSYRTQRYAALDSDGICRVRAKLTNGSIMINKENPIRIEKSTIPNHSGFFKSGVKLKVW